ncbi:hypothetical protein JOM56_001098 [Amanita muscaria]
MEEPLITKRLHISGLTPALTGTDISQRLSSFGTVKAVDGFDLLDGVGRQRKFGFVTIETTLSKFTKCCNSLSGSTWKGSKLRIGEAKPDFRERIETENAAAKRAVEQLEEDKRARKKQKLQKYGAVHATDMSLVTKENAPERPGWVVTPLGRVVQPIKMRPGRPLADTDTKTDKGKEKGQEKAKKGRTGPGKAVARARRKTIDMLKYGSVHLKGVFVDVAVPGGYSAGKYDVPPTVPERVDSSDEDGDAMATESDATEGRVEEGENSEDTSSDNTDHESESVDHDDDSRSLNRPEDPPSKNKSPMMTTTINKLKELFAPQEENEGFSLLGHLDLDLELDGDVPFPTTTEEPHPQPSQTTETIPITIPTQFKSNRTVVAIQLDPKQPLFFPLPSSSTLMGPNKGKHKDLFDIAKEKGWNWRDPSVAFYRTETEDEIRKRWETSKVELTREWKRRWKEAGKMSRRKFGGTAPGDGE